MFGLLLERTNLLVAGAEPHLEVTSSHSHNYLLQIHAISLVLVSRSSVCCKFLNTIIVFPSRSYWHQSPSFRRILETSWLLSRLVDSLLFSWFTVSPHPLNSLTSKSDDSLTAQVWCDWLLGNNDTWYPVSSSEPFAQLAQLATR